MLVKVNHVALICLPCMHMSYDSVLNYMFLLSFHSPLALFSVQKPILAY